MVVDTRNPAGVCVDSAYLAFTITSFFISVNIIIHNGHNICNYGVISFYGE